MELTQAAQLFRAELNEVGGLVAELATELNAPLDALVRAQSQATQSMARAGVILAACLGNPDTDDLRERRIYLATSLEMLYIALHVHKLLLGHQDRLEKSILGSTILAGDYCFSRSASMAVRTENPQIVAIFAQALKHVSEGNLRQIFGDELAPYDENEVLFNAGIDAASIMANISAEDGQRLSTVADELAQRIRENRALVTTDIRNVPIHQSERWEALLQWLDEAEQNGLSTPNSASSHPIS